MATTGHDVTAAAWVDLDVGPMIVEIRSNCEIKLHIGGSAPSVSSDAYHLLDFKNPSLLYTGVEKVWALLKQGASPARVVKTSTDIKVDAS